MECLTFHALANVIYVRASYTYSRAQVKMEIRMRLPFNRVLFQYTWQVPAAEDVEI